MKLIRLLKIFFVVFIILTLFTKNTYAIEYKGRIEYFNDRTDIFIEIEHDKDVKFHFRNNENLETNIVNNSRLNITNDTLKSINVFSNKFVFELNDGSSHEFKISNHEINESYILYEFLPENAFLNFIVIILLPIFFFALGLILYTIIYLIIIIFYKLPLFLYKKIYTSKRVETNNEKSE